MNLAFKITTAIAAATMGAGYAHSASNLHKAAASPPGQSKTAAGFWQQVDPDGFVGGWFYFTERNGLFEGRLVKMFQKAGAPLFATCEKCPGDQRNAAMLGLTIVKGMKRDGDKYEGGSILDPRDGSAYHAQMELSPDGQKLSVRGYLGLPVLGQTQVWTRLPDNAMAPTAIPPDSRGPASPAE
jgi:uncharacterized protein (DUF2147 family)